MDIPPTNQASFGIRTTNAFVDRLIQCVSPRSIWRVGQIETPILHSSAQAHFVPSYEVTDDWPDLNPQDLILGEFPVGLRPVAPADGSSPRVAPNLQLVDKAARRVAEGGYAIFVVERAATWQEDWERIFDTLRGQNIGVSAMIEMPEGTLDGASIRTILIILQRGVSENLFLAELVKPDQAAAVAENFVNRQSKDSLSGGMIVKSESFRTFDRLRAQLQIDALETQYKGYDHHQLGDLAMSMHRGHPEVDEDSAASNVVWFPESGRRPLTTEPPNPSSRTRSIRVALNQNIRAEYLSAFFDSEIGRLRIDQVSVGTTIPRIRIDDLRSLPVPVPSIAEQDAIVATRDKLRQLKVAAEELRLLVSLNPGAAIDVSRKVEGMLALINALSIADRIKAIIRQGESKEVEFKGTLSLCLRTGKKEKYFENAVLKTLVAFLNSSGGTLLIGVSDDGSIVGLERELQLFHKSIRDHCLLHLKNLIKNHIGEQFYPRIDYDLVVVDQVPVIIITCKSSEKACFLDGNEFYVRTNPATDLLTGQKLIEYVRARFG